MRKITDEEEYQNNINSSFDELLIGGMWEIKEWKLFYNEPIHQSNVCHHCYDLREVIYTRYDKSTYTQIKATCPRVAVVLNESGYNSTGLCVDCLLEALSNSKK